ncbi:MAG: hypothetical protein MI892_17665, partial [Desulfobacterales bacterium]|nr:hypothetical protein [Desulfobacterales bacterium]
STQAVNLKMHQTRKYTDIDNWNRVIKDYDLKINFGHYGGTEFLMDKPDPRHPKAPKFSKECRKKIQALMKKYNKDGKKRIFADCSAHSPMDGNFEPYIQQINEDLNQDHLLLMYGTDLPVVTINTLNNDYIQAYDDGISDEKAKNRFFMSNALAFLFEDGKIPKTRTDFLINAYGEKGVGKDPKDISNVSWVKSDDQGESFHVAPKYLK